MRGLEEDLCARYHSEWQPIDRDPGSTALVATVMDDTLLVANVGDCRLLLISEAADSMGNRTAFVSRATADHHCVRNPDEADRVRLAGGDFDEAGYVGSLLEVSRSMGDFHTKGHLGSNVIIAEPEVYTWALGPQSLLAVAVTDVSWSYAEWHMGLGEWVLDGCHAARHHGVAVLLPCEPVTPRVALSPLTLMYLCQTGYLQHDGRHGDLQHGVHPPERQEAPQRPRLCSQ